MELGWCGCDDLETTLAVLGDEIDRLATYIRGRTGMNMANKLVP